MASDETRSSRLLRGILDACLLSLLSEDDYYGYELAGALHQAGLPLVKEGSIYPLLARLERRGFIESYRVPAGSGPTRRYYRTTSTGKQELFEAREIWRRFSTGVDAIITRGESDG